MPAWESFGVIPLSQACARVPDEAKGVRDIAALAERFLTRQRWCRRVSEIRVGFAVPPVFGLFLASIEPDGDGDPLLWVMVGDLPPAYLVTDDAPNPAEAMRRYVEEMTRWVDAVRAGEPLDGIIPVEAAPTAEHAEMLFSRLQFIRERLVPMVE